MSGFNDGILHFNRQIKVENKLISDQSPTFLIAEAGVNHGGDMEMAHQLIDVAVAAGVDAVKFQAFKPENLILADVEKAKYQQVTTGSGESQMDMLKKLAISKQQTAELRQYCAQKGIIFLTTPYDDDSLDELDDLNIGAYKIASTDTTNLPFLRKVAAKGKPVFFSTGMSYGAEIELALQEIHEFSKDVILLQCTSNYPIMPEEVHLNVMKRFMNEYDMIVGYSDHSMSVGAAPYAVAAGAKVVEKHFTLDKTLPGPDHRASLDPAELKKFVEEVRVVEQYLGSSIKQPSLAEMGTRASLQKNLVIKQAVKKGEVFSEANITAKRTGGRGISPIYYRQVYGQVAQKDYQPDDIIDL